MHTWRQDNSDSRAQEQGHALSTKHLHVRRTLLGIIRARPVLVSIEDNALAFSPSIVTQSQLLLAPSSCIKP